MPPAPSFTWSTLFTTPNLDPGHAPNRTPHTKSPRPEPPCASPRLPPSPPSNSLSFWVQTVALRSITLSSCPGTTNVASARNGSVVLHRVASNATCETAGKKKEKNRRCNIQARAHVSLDRTKRCWSCPHTRRRAKIFRWLFGGLVSELLRPLRFLLNQEGTEIFRTQEETRRATAPEMEEPRLANVLVPLTKPHCLPAAARRVSSPSHRLRHGSLVPLPKSPDGQPPTIDTHEYKRFKPCSGRPCDLGNNVATSLPMLGTDANQLTARHSKLQRITVPRLRSINSRSFSALEIRCI